MAEQLTTSSESKRPKYSPIDTKDNNLCNKQHIDQIESKTITTTITKEHDMMTNSKSDNKKELHGQQQEPVETNLRRIIQNKLKRKTKTPISQGLVDEAAAAFSKNKKRRTKLETQSSNNVVDSCKATSCATVSLPASINKNPIAIIIDGEKRIVSKPPLPPKPERLLAGYKPTPHVPLPLQPQQPRMKRKLEDNANTIQKLNARTEQLRLEITELRTALTSERSAVRTLRAQTESESRKSRTEIKKLQDASKKVASGKKTANFEIGHAGCENADMNKLTQEIVALKDANRALEEKIQITNEAERRKASDIRSLKDSYEIRLTQVTKSAKTEINRLLEEIKTKERKIEQLKKEMRLINNATNRKETRTVQHPSEMRKLKEIERTESSTDGSNQKCISTTCGINEYHSMPHEITQRILEVHDDLHIFRNKDPTNSDTDSALSSAPPSISPQPPTSELENSDIWQSVKNYSKEISSLQNDNESLHRENELLKKELELAKQQIQELEKAAVEARNDAKIQQLMERIKYLQQQEDNLEKETHELREQNELLEFRIIELEESNDKWSLRSNSTPDTRDMWTDTEREFDDVSLYPDRTDSGITSPHCHHHLEDERNMDLSCDLTVLDPISNDELGRRIMTMTKRNNIEEYDKVCLLQILSLLNNLDIISQDSITAADDAMSIDVAKTKTSDYSSAASSPRSFLADSQSLAKTRNGKIVATVLPYNTCTLSSSQDSPRKVRSWQTSSLQESGVFEADPTETFTQFTQTDPNDFPLPPTGELCAEIQKLNKFREKIEECVSKSVAPPVPVNTILSPNSSEQRKLQFYKDRLEALEKKLAVYESSGDQQTKRLAERLQREVQLEALVKQYKQQIALLEEENSRLEEERCEFEEAENDTRLKLQRLEIDLEILSQQNLELEMSKEAAQNKLQEVRQKCTGLQDSMVAYQDRVSTLEVREKDHKNSLNLIKTAMPAILVFNSLMVSGQMNQDDQRIIDNHMQRCTCHEGDIGAIEARVKMQQLMVRERELTQNITELNRAYNETLESADNLWAQMEKDYKEQLDKSRQTECLLKSKIMKLEERITADSQSAVERLNYLEENESCYKNRICKLNKENKELALKNETLQNDYQRMKTEYIEMKNYVDVIVQQNMEREKQKNRKLEEDLASINRMLKEAEEAHDAEMQFLRNQLLKSNKELLHIEVTNSELKEEVCTLEARICELCEQHRTDQDKLRNLADELRSLEERAMNSNRSPMDAPNLAEELAPVKRMNLDKVNDLGDAAEKLAEAIAYAEGCKNCMPANTNLQELAVEIGKLAQAFLKNKRGKKVEKGADDDSPGPDQPPDGQPASQQPSRIAGPEVEVAKDDMQSSSKNNTQEQEVKSETAADEPKEENGNDKKQEAADAGSLAPDVADELLPDANAANSAQGEAEGSAKIVMHMQTGALTFPNSIFEHSYPFDSNKSKSMQKVAAEVPSELRKIAALSRISALKSLHATTPHQQAPFSSQSTVRTETSIRDRDVLKAFTEKFDLDLKDQAPASDLGSLELADQCSPLPTTFNRERSAIETLISLISESIRTDDKTAASVEASLRHLYAKDIVFRQNLHLVLRLGRDRNETPAGSVRSFEQISRAMECIRAIEAMYNPINVPVSIENRFLS